MKTCVLLDDYQGVALTAAPWQRLAGRVAVSAIERPFASPGDAAAALAEAQIVVAMRERTPFSAELLARLPKLALLVTSGMRNAAIDLEAARARGVTVCGTASSSAAPAELTWALILGLARRLVVESSQMRRAAPTPPPAPPPWQSTLGVDLEGAVLGLVGLGRIGTRMAAIGRAFGMQVRAWSPNLTPQRAETAGARHVPDLHALLAASDFVSLHLVLSDTTRGLIDAAALAAMKPGAYLVNTARAGLVDQAALIAALDRRRIAGAGLDVFDTEPLPPGHPFRRLPNVLATPHLGYVTRGNYATYYGEALEDIEAWLAGAPVRVLTPR